MNDHRGILALVICLAVPLAVAGLGGLATSSSVGTWYTTLTKPSWNPPAWVFGPVWTALYLMMGVASWLVWRERAATAVKLALIVYGAQLALNLLWSVLFFGLRRPGLALIEIVLLWAAILATIILFRRVRPLSAILLIPYLAWTTFAAVLNATLWRLN